jgi:5-methylcytosine-specific restriction endonuclease McrA
MSSGHLRPALPRITLPGLHRRHDDWKARLQISDGWTWGKIRARVHARDGVCVRCGSTRRLHVHHRIPLRYSGSNDIGNSLLCGATGKDVRTS